MNYPHKLGAGPISYPNVLHDIEDFITGSDYLLVVDSTTWIDELSVPQYRELVNYCENEFDLDVGALDDFDVSFATLGDLADKIVKLNPSLISD